MIIVAVSGGFDLIHVGNIRNIKEARELGDKLMVILTRDDQLIRKKGYYFMPYKERKEVLENLKSVDIVVPNLDTNITSDESLEFYRPAIYAKGGDWAEDNMPEIEKRVCQKIGCKIVYGVGGAKIQSSSFMANNSVERTERKEKVLVLTET